MVILLRMSREKHGVLLPVCKAIFPDKSYVLFFLHQHKFLTVLLFTKWFGKLKKGPETNGWSQEGVYSKQTARACGVLYMLIWVQLVWAGVGQWELSWTWVDVLRIVREANECLAWTAWLSLSQRSSMREPAAPREHRVHLLPPVREQKRHWGRKNTDINSVSHRRACDTLRSASPQIRGYTLSNNMFLRTISHIGEKIKKSWSIELSWHSFLSVPVPALKPHWHN